MADGHGGIERGRIGCGTCAGIREAPPRRRARGAWQVSYSHDTRESLPRLIRRSASDCERPNRGTAAFRLGQGQAKRDADEVLRDPRDRRTRRPATRRAHGRNSARVPRIQLRQDRRTARRRYHQVEPMDPEAVVVITPQLLVGETILWCDRPRDTSALRWRAIVIGMVGISALVMRSLPLDSALADRAATNSLLLALLFGFLLAE